MKIITVAIGLGVLFAAGSVVAQEPPRASDDQLSYTEYIMNDELVEGQLLRPTDDLLLERGHRPTISLIKIRMNFVPEMLKSGENL